jgi:hypothetical protein
MDVFRRHEPARPHAHVDAKELTLRSWPVRMNRIVSPVMGFFDASPLVPR